MNKFLQNLHKMLLFANFETVSREPIISDYSGGFTFTKEEGTSICILKIIDLSHSDETVLKFLCEREMASANMLITKFTDIKVLFLLVDGDASILAELPVEKYDEQSPYAVYWHLDIYDKTVTVPQGQPTDIMGIKAAIDGAFSPIHNLPNLLDDDDYNDEDNENPKNHKNTSAEIKTLPVKNRKMPLCTILIGFTNVLILLAMYFQGYSEAPVLVAAQFGAIIPHLILEDGQFYRLFTAMFVHFGWVHLVFNLAGLLIFGIRVERYFGKLQFLLIYLLAGLTSSVASLFLTQGFSAGASGAVYGLVGAVFIYTRLTKSNMDIINSRIVLVYIVLGLAMGFFIPNTDYFGHIGGLAAGILLGFAVLKLEKIKK
ncbi:MAG: rhomboid family intramembrane serine protease [Defluviitaleaceae bacterium]|nr:rhomboid family intramembrane serine protease [Defluviitaleaceae bacterium]